MHDELDDYNEALEAYLKAIALDRKVGEAWAKAAYVCIELGEYERAQKLLAKAESVEPELKEVICYRARLAFKQSEEARGYDLLRDLVAKNPGCKECLPTKEDFEAWWGEEEFKEIYK
jgi:tetratricopeptide (TPR) repeat protein